VGLGSGLGVSVGSRARMVAARSASLRESLGWVDLNSILPTRATKIICPTSKIMINVVLNLVFIATSPFY
jgi:hypothetical protein